MLIKLIFYVFLNFNYYSYIYTSDLTAKSEYLLSNLPRIVSGNVNVTSYVGDTVTLPCEVANLSKYHVIWLKFNENIPLTLTVGYEQFSRNMRYRVVRHQEEPIEAWNFEIRKVTMDDKGLYECMIKINSKHKIRAFVNLEVKPAKEILYNNAEALAFFSNNYVGNKQFPEKFSSYLSAQTLEKVSLAENSVLLLDCNVTTPISHYRSLIRKSSRHDTIQWHKNGKPIYQDSKRLKKYLSENLNYLQMEINPLRISDSGLYQCKKNDKVLRNVYVEVTSSASSNISKLIFWICIFFMVFIRV